MCRSSQLRLEGCQGRRSTVQQKSESCPCTPYMAKSGLLHRWEATTNEVQRPRLSQAAAERTFQRFTELRMSLVPSWTPVVGWFARVNMANASTLSFFSRGFSFLARSIDFPLFHSFIHFERAPLLAALSNRVLSAVFWTSSHYPLFP